MHVGVFVPASGGLPQTGGGKPRGGTLLQGGPRLDRKVDRFKNRPYISVGVRCGT
jgi:hypothetical protein